MMIKVLPQGMQHGSDADLRTEVLGSAPMAVSASAATVDQGGDNIGR
jgi:hypothetical protein